VAPDGIIDGAKLSAVASDCLHMVVNNDPGLKAYLASNASPTAKAQRYLVLMTRSRFDVYPPVNALPTGTHSAVFVPNRPARVKGNSKNRPAYVWLTDENGGCPLNNARMVSVESEITPVMVGATVLAAPSFDAASVVEQVARHRVTHLYGLPVMFAIAGAKADEREVLLAMLEADAVLVNGRPGQTLIGDRNYFGRDFEKAIADSDLALLRPVRKGEARRAGQQFLKPLRQVIESVNQTLKAQLDLEGHGGRTGEGIAARILYRILALTAAIWHNDKTGQDVKRSLIAYDH